MNAAAIALALGGAREERPGRWRCRCLLCGGRLALKDIPGGPPQIWCWGHCAPGDAWRELRRLELIGPRTPESEAERQRRVEAAAHKRQAAIAVGLDIWSQSHPATMTSQVPRYLASRGIAPPIPKTIRMIGIHQYYGWHPGTGERRPAMVALIQHVEFGRVGTLRTFLATDGSAKASFENPRWFDGRPSGGAVRLAPIGPELLIGEGLESTMSAMQRYRLPAWAALSAPGIKNLVLPPSVRRVLICADHDENEVGVRAARAAAQRWLDEDRHVDIVMPAKVDTDFNDLGDRHG